MKPAPFAYHAPRSASEAIDLLASYDGEAKLLAGGQSLMPLLNLRLAAPEAIIDVNSVGTLSYHRVELDELIVGALCRHRAIEQDTKIGRCCGAVADAVPTIGHVSIRNRGTVVGSICHADPSAEWPTLAVLLNAFFHVTGPGGSRSIPAEHFFQGFLSTTLEPDELVAEARFQLPPPSAGSAFVEFARRHGDFAIVGVCALLDVSAHGVIQDVRIAVTGAGPAPVRIAEAETALVQHKPSEAIFAEAASLTAKSLDPPSDAHGSSSYRRRLAEVLTRRALATADQRRQPGKSTDE